MKETILNFPNTAILQTVVGEHNSSLKTIETRLAVRISHTPEGLKINGNSSDVDLASSLLYQIYEIVSKGDFLYEGDLERAISILAEDRRFRLSDFFRDQIRIAGRTHAIVPKTPNQQKYLQAIKTSSVIFGVGPAGTGKTYLAMAMAMAALFRKDVKRVVLCRPAVEAGEKLGFLPGDMAEKVNPYLRPLYDALYDMVDVERGQELITKGIIEVAPLAFMRGRTLSNAFIILDEGQNTTKLQMKMLLTRLGQNSRCIITGDITQIDLPKGVDSGLSHALKLLKKINGISQIQFNSKDVVRHPIVSAIIDAYDKESDKR